MKTKPNTAQARRDTQMKVVREVWAWVQNPETLDRLFGPRLSYFETRNEMRRILGLEPLTRADIPPGEDWDAIPPRLTARERKAAIRKILGIREPTTEPPPAQAEHILTGDNRENRAME